jgi:ABC-type sugar transport system permease subunit
MAERTTRLARSRGLYAERERTGVILVLPALIVVSVLILVPIAQAIYFSMTNWNGIVSQWVGPQTYATMFQDPTFWRVLENNLLLLLAVPATMACGVFIAALLHEQVAGYRLFRAAIIIPTAVSWVVLGVLGVQVFAQHGLVNGLLGSVGLGALAQNWLGEPLLALGAVGVTFIYSLVGINTLIFVTGMSTIDPQVLEAARIDGATWFQSFLRISIPLLRRYFLFAFVVTAISAFTALFSLIYTMTGGGPNYGTTTLEVLIYQTAFSTGSFGQGALLGVILFVILFGVSMAQLRLMTSDD